MIVVMVPVKEARFLMVYNPYRGWEFPGGKVEEGESPEEAVIRECKEEAGLVLSDIEIVEKSESMVVFRGRIKVVNGGEMKWSMFSKLPKNLAFPRDEALRFLKYSFEDFSERKL